MTIDDMKSVRKDLETLKRKLTERAKRISLIHPTNTYENNSKFNMWANILLTTLSDKNWWFLHSPLLNRSINQAWRSMIPE